MVHAQRLDGQRPLAKVLQHGARDEDVRDGGGGDGGRHADDQHAPVDRRGRGFTVRLPRALPHRQAAGGQCLLYLRGVGGGGFREERQTAPVAEFHQLREVRGVQTGGNQKSPAGGEAVKMEDGGKGRHARNPGKEVWGREPGPARECGREVDYSRDALFLNGKKATGARKGTAHTATHAPRPVSPRRGTRAP